jgi:hypothetical protein
MAGRGPAPKDPSRRARTNADPHPSIVLEFRPSDQPDLPPAPGDADWHPMARKWWDMWSKSAQAETFTESDWLFILDTVLMEQAMWADGELKWAAEVRLRVAKFGATLEDRARLRMVFADADAKDSKRPSDVPVQSAARKRRGPLRAV